MAPTPLAHYIPAPFVQTHALSSDHCHHRTTLSNSWSFLRLSLNLLLSGYVCITTDGPDATYVPEFVSYLGTSTHFSPTSIQSSATPWTVPHARMAQEGPTPSIAPYPYPRTCTPHTTTSKPARMAHLLSFLAIALNHSEAPHFLNMLSRIRLMMPPAWWAGGPHARLRWRSCTACTYGRLSGHA